MGSIIVFARTEAKLARDVEVEDEEARPGARVARQVAGAPYGRKLEGFEQTQIERLARTPCAQQFQITCKDWAVIAHVIKVAIRPAG